MKMNRIFILLLILSGYFQLTAENAKKLNIAVNNLKPKGIENSDADIISDRLGSKVISTGIFRVMERAEINTIAGQ